MADRMKIKIMFFQDYKYMGLKFGKHMRRILLSNNTQRDLKSYFVDKKVTAFEVSDG